MDRDRLLRQLHGYNPWWSGRARPPLPFHRVAFYRCLAALRTRAPARAVILSGPRRVGKSTVLHQVAHSLIGSGAKPRSVLYVSLDDNLLKLAPLSEILALYREEISPEGEEAFLLLDEVHYAAGWEQEIKTLVDHHPEYRILATGSSGLEQASGGTHAGVGRWVTVPIPTLSFFEFLHIRQEAPAGVPEGLRVLQLRDARPAELLGIAAALRPTMPLFRQYLLVGGFPETARLKEVGECQKLLREDIVDRVLKRDITSLFSVRNVNEIEKLFLYICLHSGGRLNVQTCAEQLGANRQTINNHLELLVRANLLYRLFPDEAGGKKTLKARYKYYLVDAALRNAVLLTGEEILRDTTEMGRIVETTVLRHLYASYYRETPTFAYWLHPASDQEVDIVMRVPGYVVPVEVKYREEARCDPGDGLARYCRAEPKAHPILVSQRDADFSVDRVEGVTPPILRVPAHILCYLIGQSERANAGA